jgi:hypothetical protein
MATVISTFLLLGSYCQKLDINELKSCVRADRNKCIMIKTGIVIRGSSQTTANVATPIVNRKHLFLPSESNHGQSYILRTLLSFRRQYGA